jgi:acetyltransferase-like isoleucine patch superfamily enzyme
VPGVLDRPPVPDTPWVRAISRVKRAASELVHRGHELVLEYGAIGPDTGRGRRFGRFGQGSVICFPPNTIFNEQFIHIGAHTMIGPQITLSAGMVPGQACITDPVVSIGDRCLIGKGSGIVGHLRIEIGDDVWTGHHVYITDQNHGYRDIDLPISQQSMPERPVRIGNGSWLGHGSIVLPGAQIGDHVVIGANSVVTGIIPDNCVAVGAPARIVRHHRPGVGWVDGPPESDDQQGPVTR